ncbi:MAG: hypothetical protein U0837_18330 [Dehalococcoidia bacterium]|jgi:hypothetical protein
MGFYYGSGEPPKKDTSDSSWRETLTIIWVVFKTLALPLGLLFGAVFGIIFIIYAFTISGWLGLALLVLIVGAVVARGVWEAKHPPELL